MRLLHAPALAIAAIAVWPGPAVACECARPLPLQTAAEYRRWLEGFDRLVFRGTAIGVKQDGWARLFTFRVERHWKGVQGAEIAIRTESTEAACGREFELGLEYFVVAVTPLQPSTSLCITFTEIEERRFRAALGEGSPPPKP